MTKPGDIIMSMQVWERMREMFHGLPDGRDVTRATLRIAGPDEIPMWEIEMCCRTPGGDIYLDGDDIAKRTVRFKVVPIEDPEP